MTNKERLEEIKGYPKEQIRHLQSHVYKLEQQNKRYREALENFKLHGTRHDTNPTLVMDDKQVFTLMNYIRSMDDYVRDKARQALEE